MHTFVGNKNRAYILAVRQCADSEINYDAQGMIQIQRKTSKLAIVAIRCNPKTRILIARPSVLFYS